MPNSADKSLHLEHEESPGTRANALGGADDVEDFDLDIPEFPMPSAAEPQPGLILADEDALPPPSDDAPAEVVNRQEVQELIQAPVNPPSEPLDEAEPRAAAPALPELPDIDLPSAEIEPLDADALFAAESNAPQLLDALSDAAITPDPDTPEAQTDALDALLDDPEAGEVGYDRQELVKTIQMQAVDRTSIEREIASARGQAAAPIEDHRFAPDVLVSQPRELVARWGDMSSLRNPTEELPEVEVVEEELPELEIEPEELEDLPELELEPVSDPIDAEPPRGTPIAGSPALKPPPRPSQPTPMQGRPAARASQPTPVQSRPATARPSGGGDSEMQGLVQELLDDHKPVNQPEHRPRWARRQVGRDSWFKKVFTDEYLRTLPEGFEQQGARDISFITESLSLQEGARILDLACGFGRHTIPLARSGYEMAGLDLSMPLLQRALSNAQRHNLSIKFIHGDMRSMNFNGIFDGCFLWYSSFGYFDDLTNFKVLQGVTRALKPGGRFLLDMLNRDYVVAEMPARTWWEGSDCIFLEEVDFDDATSVIHTKRSFIYEDGTPPLEQNTYIRLYSMHEILNLLQGAGLRALEVSGELHHPGVFLGPNSSRMIILAEKPIQE